MSRFVCDRCGWAYDYSVRKKETSGVIVCPDCYDGQFDLLNHPQNDTPDLREREYLKEPRPETVLATTGDASWTPRQTVWYKGD